MQEHNQTNQNEKKQQPLNQPGLKNPMEQDQKQYAPRAEAPEIKKADATQTEASKGSQWSDQSKKDGVEEQAAKVGGDSKVAEKETDFNKRKAS